MATNFHRIQLNHLIIHALYVFLFDMALHNWHSIVINLKQLDSLTRWIAYRSILTLSLAVVSSITEGSHRFSCLHSTRKFHLAIWPVSFISPFRLTSLDMADLNQFLSQCWIFRPIWLGDWVWLVATALEKFEFSVWAIFPNRKKWHRMSLLWKRPVFRSLPSIFYQKWQNWI